MKLVARARSHLFEVCPSTTGCWNYAFKVVDWELSVGSHVPAQYCIYVDLFRGSHGEVYSRHGSNAMCVTMMTGGEMLERKATTQA